MSVRQGRWQISPAMAKMRHPVPGACRKSDPPDHYPPAAARRASARYAGSSSIRLAIFRTRWVSWSLQTPIRQDDTPHDFSQHHLLSQIVLGGDKPGELKMIQRLCPCRLGQAQKLCARRVVEAEMTLKRVFNVPLLFGTEFVVGVSQLEEQRTSSQLHPAG